LLVSDEVILAFDRVLRAVSGSRLNSLRKSPADNMPEPTLTQEEKKLSGALMRINHTGEVCAQALYQGQAITSRSPDLRESLKHAQLEEIDHLAWCADRLYKLDAHSSRLNPLWYGGSLVLGALAGAMGDEWSLGFLAETERQVEAHLCEHREKLPEADKPSEAVLAQMQQDEAEHADMAEQHGARILPFWMKKGMHWTARGMKAIAYYL